MTFTIFIYNVEYDVSKFSQIHPGGSIILEKYKGKDATEIFEHFNHSQKAKTILKILQVSKSKEPVVEISDTILSIIRILREDGFQIHKILGLLCLGNFFIKFYLGFLGRQVFNGSRDVLFSIGLHLFLNLSSFIFYVPKERTKPMIWKEFRAHNLLFVVRSCITIFLNWSSQNRELLFFLKCGLLMGVLITADIITWFYFPKDHSSSRIMPYWEGCSSQRELFHKTYYTISQFEATFACFSKEYHTPYFILMPIQLSPFLMTLVRKGFISSQTWHNLYFISLYIPYLLYRKNLIFIYKVFPLSMVCAYLQMKYNTSKYLIWSVIMVFMWYLS